MNQRHYDSLTILQFILFLQQKSINLCHTRMFIANTNDKYQELSTEEIKQLKDEFLDMAYPDSNLESKG